MNDALHTLACRLYLWLLELEASIDRAQIESQIKAHCEEVATRADCVAVLTFLYRLLDEEKQHSGGSGPEQFRARIRRLILSQEKN